MVGDKRRLYQFRFDFLLEYLIKYFPETRPPFYFDPVRLCPCLRFFTVGEMQSLISEAISSPSVAWGSVIYLPGPVYTFFSELEELFPVKKNPLGAFVGMAFAVNYTYQTVQNPILNSFDVKAKTRAAAPEAVRVMLQEGDR